MRTPDLSDTNAYSCFVRSICVERSNVILPGVTHTLEGEHETYGVPCNGFHYMS